MVSKSDKAALSFAVQAAHLTVPATRWAMVESAVTRSPADLVMLDLEDSIPRDDNAALALGRANLVRAFNELDWGRRRRFFRPRGLELDPELSDLRLVLPKVGGQLEGIVIPKLCSAADVAHYDRALTELESDAGLELEHVKLHLLIESVAAEEQAFEIARASNRTVALVFGAFDYWSSLRMALVPYRFDHPALREARLRIVKAAASISAMAIAEMTTNFPTKEKSEAERARALDDCKVHAEYARDLGMTGKWTGHPAQIGPILSVFTPPKLAIERALRQVRMFAEAERQGVGALMIDGEMADRATDRVNRILLSAAHTRGLLDEAIAVELGLSVHSTGG